MAVSSVDAQSVGLGHYGRVIRRRWYVVVLGLVLGLLGGAVYLTLATRTATATATVNINVISSQPFDNSKPESQLIDPKTEIAFARSSQVLSSAAKELPGNQTLADMRQNTSVAPVSAATVVKISFISRSRKNAVAGANAVAKQYLAYRSQVAASKVHTVFAQLTAQRDTLKQNLLDANERLTAAKAGSPDRVQAESDRQLINIQLTSLVGQINQLDSIDTTGGSLISPADSHAITMAPSMKMVFGPAALLGIMFGLVAAFAVNGVDRRVDDSRELTDAGGGSVLSKLPQHQAQIPAAAGDLDALRSLRERLLATLDEGSNLVVVDLTTEGEPSDVGVNLAVVMAEGRRPVRLILPQHHGGQFVSHVRTALGLSVKRRSDGRVVYASKRVGSLSVVVSTGGAKDDEPSASALASLLSERTEDCLMTVIALPPNASRSLRLSAGRLGHSIILVANRHGTSGTAVRELSAELAAIGATVHGSVLVPKDRVFPAANASSPAGPDGAPATRRALSRVLRRQDAEPAKVVTETPKKTRADDLGGDEDTGRVEHVGRQVVER